MADKATLANYFGKGFQASSLPARTDIENIPKATLYSSLTAATRHTKTKGKYGKGEHSFEILGLIDPAKVLAASPYAQRLITKLNNPTKPLKDDK